MVNAGTNHRAFSHIWLGKKTDRLDSVPVMNNGSLSYVKVPIYKSVPIYLAAVDGITLPALDKGNR